MSIAVLAPFTTPGSPAPRSSIKRSRLHTRHFCFFSMLFLASLSQAAPLGTVRVAMSEAAPPTSFVVDGQASGMFREMLEALFSRVPAYKLEFHALPWTRAQWAVQHDEMDMFVTFPSANRARYASFTDNSLYVMDYGNIVYDLRGSKAGQIELARSFKDLMSLVFVTQDGVAWENENVPDYIQRYKVNGPASLMHMTFRRAAGDFFIMNTEQAVYYAKQLGYENHLGMKKVMFIPNSLAPFHIGLRKSYPDSKSLLAALDGAMRHPDFLMKKRAIELRYKVQPPLRPGS